jgi:hypothetical protein
VRRAGQVGSSLENATLYHLSYAEPCVPLPEIERVETDRRVLARFRFILMAGDMQTR